MTEVQASFFDGSNSRRHAVRLVFEQSGQVRLVGAGADRVYALRDTRIADRLGNTPRAIYLPDGGKCETGDNDTIDEVLRRYGLGLGGRGLHALESRLRFVVPALLLCVALIWSAVQFGIPWLAERVAYAVPAAMQADWDTTTLATLDRLFFEPSQLPAGQRDRLVERLAAITGPLQHGEQYRLIFRHSPRLGANALALPSGTIVVTDGLVRLAQDENELVAVMAHEVGHVVHRHGLRHILQNSAVALLVATVTGDIASLSALAATVPTVLVEAKYSRAFELEADQYAVDYLRLHGIAPRHFANILRRLQEASSSAEPALGYLSSHPATSERIRVFSLSAANS